jgi:hypothetical protein
MDESCYRFEVRIPKPTKRWFRFSLLSLLILITGVCLVLGLWPQRGDRTWHAIQLQQFPAQSFAEVIEKLHLIGPDASTSKTVTPDDGKLSVEVDADTNTIQFWANEAELTKIEELLLKIGEAPNSPAPQRDPSRKSKFRYLSHQQAAISM